LSTTEERVARLEAIVPEHNRRLALIEQSLSRLESSVATLTQRTNDAHDEVIRASRRNMWAVGVTISIASIITNVVILLVLH
jgi:t-SNARE complex subunit (syntaxin)